jgi:membrane associated rhomboid family serine protease
MCPSCGKLAGIGERCPYCGTSLGGVVNAVRTAARSTATRGGHRVTLGLVIANVLVYFLVVMVGGQELAEGGMEILVPDRLTLVRLGLQVPPLVEAGEWWRLVMPIFLHLGILHIIMNTLVLWVTGRWLEEDIGGWAFFFMYIAAGVAGFALSQVVGLGGGGASGAVAGVLGCTIVKRRLSDGNFRAPVTAQAIQLVVLNGIFGLVVSKVNNYAHLGGLLTGATLGFVIWWAESKRFGARLWLGAGLAAGAVVVASVVMMLRWEMPAAFAMEPERVQRTNVAISCVNFVQDARDGRGLLGRAAAQRGLACMQSVAPIDGDADRALSLIRSGLERVVRGQQEGSSADDEEGHRRIEEGMRSFAVWHREHVGSDKDPSER